MAWEINGAPVLHSAVLAQSAGKMLSPLSGLHLLLEVIVTVEGAELSTGLCVERQRDFNLFPFNILFDFCSFALHVGGLSII